MNRRSHLDFAKDRAFKILDSEGNALKAWVSFISDLSKHDELKDHIAIGLGIMTLPKDAFAIQEYRRFIDGFN